MYSAKQGEMSPRPIPPTEGSCCQCGCYPCVWDYYRWALEDWEKAQSVTERTGELST